jgi:hypothetical protein
MIENDTRWLLRNGVKQFTYSMVFIAFQMQAAITSKSF